MDVSAEDGQQHRFLDVWPASSERERLAKQYGTMVLPVHVAMPCRWEERDGVRTLLVGLPRVALGSDADRLRDGQSTPMGGTAPSSGGPDLLVATPEELRRLYAAHAGDDEWEFSLAFRRQR